IVNQAHVTPEKIDVIRGAILSKGTVNLDNSLFKGSASGSSTYYLGWEGAIKSEKGTPTKYYLPADFDVTALQQNVGDVTIFLIKEQSPDGLSGFTENIADGNQILRSKITIFEADKLSDNEIGAVARHEFGHALGLAHSAAPYDLMHATIQTNYPYISPCDLQALSLLYDGEDSRKVICTK
ncbi:MAG TPA: matrixin family metalloprotease, partial [Candidatus Nitrosotalea sp.]|nr:matrixin family metalloprotease [Candidatus Nitrosotalea sp.]